MEPVSHLVFLKFTDLSDTGDDAATLFVSQFIVYHVPRRKLSKREIKVSTKPWITKYILAKIRYKGKLYSKIIMNKHSNLNLT